MSATPGTVALIRVSSEYSPELGILDSSGQRWYVAGPRLGSQHGWYADRTELVRPLVVIDPEDREQVERLVNAVLAPLNDRVLSHGISTAQAALRSLIAPPKPPEPTGLGAVVEDADGVSWVRIHPDPGSPGTCPARWLDTTDQSRVRVRYGDIDAVRVLNEGVTDGAA